jgi:hypothetical protein
VRLPSSWQAGQPIRVEALGQDGRARGSVDGTIEGGRFLFRCEGPQPGSAAPTYVISVG